MELKLPVHLLSFLHKTFQIDMYLYERIDMRDRNSKFDYKTKTTPGAGRRREDGRGRLRQSQEGRAK